MSLDPLDTAFLRRLASRSQGLAASVAARPRPARRRPVDGGGSRATAAAAAVTTAAQPVQAAVEDRRSDALPPPPATPRSVSPESVAVPPEPIVAQLLAEAPEQWTALATHVEAARQRGLRIIAVAGGRAGEGRTTLVRCLAESLRARGRDVACAAPHDLPVVAGGEDGRRPTHDKRIILVDAGIWFPPGPLRRSHLQVASLGCEAAILVRRAGTVGGSARQAALAALGIEVLGEVLTFTSRTDPADDVPGAAMT